MAQTYTPIQSYTVSGSTTTDVTFTAIPSTYTDLYLVVNVIGASGTTDAAIKVGNGSIDTGSNYSETVLRGDGSSPASARYSESYINAVSSWGSGKIYQHNISIQNYANTSTYKTMLCRSTDAAGGVGAMVILWRSTSAINQVQVKCLTGGIYITAGSTFSLYGVKSA